MTRLQDSWKSFQAFPLWVRLWMAIALGPVNFSTFLFWHEPFGPAVAILSSFGLLVNFALVPIQRGFSRATAIPHLVFWAPLMVVLAIFVLPVAEGIYLGFLYVLIVVNVISMIFDIREVYLWLRGDRTIAGRES